jgi:hypothetical protein
MKERSHRLRVVNLTVVGGYPASGSGREYGSIGPAIRVKKMYEDDVALS